MNIVNRSIWELIFASALWGFGFVATKWALEGMGPYSMTLLRFGLAFLLPLPFLFITSSGRRSFKLADLSSDLRFAFIPGLLLGLMIALQTYGLKLTSVANSSFLTSLYVILVPLGERFFFHVKPSRSHYISLFFAMLGTALMTGVYREFRLNEGDLFTLLCMLAATAHILFVQRFAPKISKPFEFNIAQSFWATMVGLFFALAAGELSLLKNESPLPSLISSYSLKALAGLLFLVVGSTLVAFWIQVRAQRHLSASTASLLFLLEAPFALLFGLLLLDEQVEMDQIVGASLILASSSYLILKPRRQSSL